MKVRSVGPTRAPRQVGLAKRVGRRVVSGEVLAEAEIPGGGPGKRETTPYAALSPPQGVLH